MEGKVIERECVVAMPLDPDERVLLQNKDSGYIFWPNMWCTFGGGMKPGENPKDTLSREMQEENGLILMDISLFESRSFEDHSQFGDSLIRKGTVHYFGAKFDGDLSKIVFREGAGWKMFEIEELERYHQSGLVVPHDYVVVRAFLNSLE